MDIWYPKANRNQPGHNGGTYTSGPLRGVLHTTEGSSANGAFAAFKAHNSWPHFTVDQLGQVWQHLPIDVAARALRNASGGVQTNRQGAIQIEVVGFASKPEWPLPQVAGMLQLMRWIEAQAGVKPHGPEFGGPDQYGLNNPLEMSPSDWEAFDGWCGHQHVPENTHWDPGPINLQALLPSKEQPMIQINAPIVGIAPYTENGTTTGYYLVSADGGVFAHGAAKFFGRQVEFKLPEGDSWTPAS